MGSNLLKSFIYAFQGMAAAFREEPKIRLHALAAILVLLFCWTFNFNAFEWIISIVCIFLVLAAELFNTAIEKLADVVTKEHHEGIKQTKDIAAAAVVCTVFCAVLVWIILLYHHFITV